MKKLLASGVATAYLEVCAVAQNWQIMELVVPQVQLFQSAEVSKLIRDVHQLVVCGIEHSQACTQGNVDRNKVESSR